MGLKLLILLLLLVMRSSLSEKADNHENGKHNKNKDIVECNFFQSPVRMKREASIFDKAEKSDRKSKKLRTVSANELVVENTEEKEGGDEEKKDENAQKENKGENKREAKEEANEEEEEDDAYQEEITVLNETDKNLLSFLRRNSDQKIHSKVKLYSQHERREKRETQELWIQREFNGYDDILNLHAFIIRDEEATQCGTAANKITNTRYFMCSGVILTKKFILTTASCVQFAHIFEHHIKANLSVLIGAVSNEAHVIKVKKYEMHPEYKNNAESTDYALHNLAIITIACDIPQEVLSLPTFPARYEDVSHMCCSNSCQILTIVQTPTNRHMIQLMDARYIPRAVHDDDDVRGKNKFELKKKRTPSAKKIKRETDIAPAPIFLLPEAPKNEETTTVNTVNSQDAQNANNNNKIIKQLSNFTEEILMEKITEELLRGLFREKYDGNLNKPQTNNTQEIMRGIFKGTFDLGGNNNSPLTDEQMKAISKFIKLITEKAMSRVMKVLDEAKIDKLFSSSKEENGENLVDNIAQIVKDNVLLELEEKLSPRNLFNNTFTEPSLKYVHCPPLGTPIIVNKTLIALVAYTCDDLQSWVPWQYVNIYKNLQWIENTINERKNHLTKSESTFGDNENIHVFESSAENVEKINKYSDEENVPLDNISHNRDEERFKKELPISKFTDKSRRHLKNIKTIFTNYLKNHPNSIFHNITEQLKFPTKQKSRES